MYCMSGLQTLCTKFFPIYGARRPRNLTLILTRCLLGSFSRCGEVTTPCAQARQEELGVKQVNKLSLRGQPTSRDHRAKRPGKAGMQVCLVPVLRLPPFLEEEILLDWQPHQAQTLCEGGASPEGGARPPLAEPLGSSTI